MRHHMPATLPSEIAPAPPAPLRPSSTSYGEYEATADELQDAFPTHQFAARAVPGDAGARRRRNSVAMNNALRRIATHAAAHSGGSGSRSTIGSSDGGSNGLVGPSVAAVARGRRASRSGDTLN
eukprot:Opistho-1_new@104908